MDNKFRMNNEEPLDAFKVDDEMEIEKRVKNKAGMKSQYLIDMDKAK
jgi:hypothetical protein